MIHYRNDSNSYEELLEYLRRELRDSSGMVIGSDDAPNIKSAVEAVFPDSIHLFCVRHVRNDIERQLTKIQLSKDERYQLLEYLFGCPESLLQSETEDEHNRHLDGLREILHAISDRNGRHFSHFSDFFTWFSRYQLDTFRHHLIASVLIEAGYLDRHGSPQLFYNNGVQTLNHALKHDANWEV